MSRSGRGPGIGFGAPGRGFPCSGGRCLALLFVPGPGGLYFRLGGCRRFFFRSFVCRSLFGGRHGFGHSLGLDIHEAPNANPSGETLMPVGAVVSAEPGIYLPGKFGVRIEDVMVLNETGCEVITKAPKEQLIVL